ncbi:hypothetical protein [Fusobacterium polymorphum]|jgi:hypothetical protein|uniref:hypothetical protein n=1 Tax=Fusobacterium nucleatum subsp. polymorphum TaxID=76857 RepID=UPI00205243B3|nr:MAG TPA: hypothetical protein [Caudoviricetes sp.]
MKTIDKIQFEIDRLNKLILDLEEELIVVNNGAKRSLLNIKISQNKIRIKALEWVKED